jgi:hypothetical protein
VTYQIFRRESLLSHNGFHGLDILSNSIVGIKLNRKKKVGVTLLEVILGTLRKSNIYAVQTCT